MGSYTPEQRAEIRHLKAFATKHHAADHRSYRDPWCRTCKRLDLHDFGRRMGLIPAADACCGICQREARRLAQQGA